MPRYKFKDGVPFIIEVWKVGCKKRGGPKPYFDESGQRHIDDPRILHLTVSDVALSPGLQARAVYPGKLRAILRQFIEWGWPVVV
jgi:hypothetical protein